MIRPFSQFSGGLTRQWWWRSLTSFIWILVITILIWVWADLRFVDSAEFRATVYIDSSANPNLIVVSRREVEVAFKLEGNRAALDKFQKELLEKSSVIKYDVSTFLPEDHTQSVPAMLSRACDLSKLGINVLSTSPGSITIQIDTKTVVRDVPVDVEFVNGSLSPEKSPKVSPGKVDVTIAGRELAKIRKTQALEKLRLSTSPIDLKAMPTGQEMEREVEIVPDLSGVPVELSVSKATVNFEVVSRTAQKDYNVGVRILVPLNWLDDGTWDDYKLVRQDQFEWRRHVALSGSQQDLDRLKSEDIDAYVALTDKDKEPVESWLTRDIQFRFPADMRVSVVGETPKVSFKLVKGAAASP